MRTPAPGRVAPRRPGHLVRLAGRRQRLRGLHRARARHGQRRRRRARRRQLLPKALHRPLTLPHTPTLLQSTRHTLTLSHTPTALRSTRPCFARTCLTSTKGVLNELHVTSEHRTINLQLQLKLAHAAAASANRAWRVLRVRHLALNDVHGLTAVLMLLSKRERRALHILPRAHAPARPHTVGPQCRLLAFSLSDVLIS